METEETDRKRCSCSFPHRLRLSLLILFIILWTISDKLLKKRVQNVFGTRYALFQSQLAALAYSVLVSAALLIALCLGKVKILSEHKRLLFLLKLGLIGFLDGVKHFLESIGGPNTPGSIQVLLSGLNLSLTMVCSILILRSRYHWLQYVGAALMILGAPAVAIPQFLAGKAMNIVWYSVLIYASHRYSCSLLL